MSLYSNPLRPHTVHALTNKTSLRYAVTLYEARHAVKKEWA